MPKAIALLSGGLDSLLATIVMVKQGVEVTAVKFFTPFDIKTKEDSKYISNLFENANRYGYKLIFEELADKFIDIVRRPEHGYGKNMNPCVDCRILMLKESKRFMNDLKADFIITGEVIGQRPMSQRIETLYHIDKEADLYGYVVRPLSAKLLKPTVPELKGIINREMLYDFNGRTRKPQLMLAKEFALNNFPSPSGGCLLTDPIYSLRLKDLMKCNPDFTIKDIKLLRFGRHFRYSDSCKIIVGRDKDENKVIEMLSGDEDYILRVEGYGSPLTLIRGTIDGDTLKVAGSICARYSDAKKLQCVEVKILSKGMIKKILVRPAQDDLINELRIEKDLKPNGYSLIS